MAWSEDDLQHLLAGGNVRVIEDKKSRSVRAKVVQLDVNKAHPMDASNTHGALATTHRIGGAGVMGTRKSITPVLSLPTEPLMLPVQLVSHTRAVAVEDLLCNLSVPGDPYTKGSPRFHGHVHMEPKTRIAQRALRTALQAAFPGREPNRTADIGVSVAFYTKTRQRRDLDNLLKLVFDACNGVIWGDDLQVNEIWSTVTRGDPKPRTDILIYALPAAPVPVCETCHGQMPSRGKIVTRTENKRFCSKACYDVAQQKGRYVACVTCGTRIYRDNEKLQQANWYCSSRCRVLAYAEQKTCKICGQAYSVSRSVAARRASFCSTTCRELWHAQKRAASQKRGICPGCGQPCSRQKHRTAYCHPCYLKLRGAVGSQSITPAIEQEMLRLRKDGASIRIIASTLGYSRRTVENCVFLLENSPTPEQLTFWEATG